MHQSSSLSAKRQQLWIAGTCALLAYTYLCWSSQAYGQASLVDLLLSATISFAASVFVWNSYRNTEHLPLLDILVFALLFRFIGVFTFPVLEDDFYRFLWDGFVTIEQGTPYDTPPSDWFSRDLPVPVEALLDSINYPDIATVYGPSLQWLFALSYLIAPGELWPIKCFLLIADIILIVALLRLAPAKHLVLYAWSPLVIKEFVISMHPDLIGMTFVVLALLAYRSRFDTLMGSLLALALGVKVFVIVLVPFLLLLRWRAWLGFVVTALFISLPFGLLASWIPEGLSAMGAHWLFNAVLYELLGGLIDWNILKLILLVAFMLVAGTYGLRWFLKYRQADAVRDLPRADIIFAGLLIVLPVLNPWYLIWILPFAVIWPSAWAWVASFSVLLSYGSAINLPVIFGLKSVDYQIPVWAVSYTHLTLPTKRIV